MKTVQHKGEGWEITIDPNGYFEKIDRNEQGKVTYYENSNGLWFRYEYDEQGNKTYYEDSHGYKHGTEHKLIN